MAGPTVSGKKRLFVALGGIAFIFILLIIRLFWIQIIDGKRLSEMAQEQQTQDTSLSAARGTITDTNGVVLAQSGTAYKVLLNPYQLSRKQEDLPRIVRELSDILDLDSEYVMKQATKKNSNDVYYKEVILKRQVEREVVDEIKSRMLGSGVYTAIDSKRYYPEGSLFSQLLGFTTVDGTGQAGLEQKYNKYLAGENGRMITETDANHKAIAYGSQEILDPEDGYDIKLTTDSVVESFLEKALKEALEVNKAETAQGIIMSCKTGRIIAMSTQPDFDPNDPPRSDVAALNALSRNRIVADAYEPGSTFKIITLSAALDSGNVTSANEYNCGGSYTVNSERIKCWKSGGHGHETLKKAVQNSCNPAFMQMALSMGKSTFYDYIYAFGFGSSTGSGISGETSGIVTHEKYITENNLARIGFGQSIAVTPIQLCTAVCAAVNGGELMQPYVVDSIVNKDGRVILKNEPTMVRRVIGESTSAQVREILESVVSEGSGKNASIPGYRVGGKTGTAQKYGSDGKVAQGQLIASFIGFAPADDPKYVCLILVDEPQVGTIFGSTVAAPFVKQVMEEVLRYSGYLPESTEGSVLVPDVTGMSVSDAKHELSKVGLEATFQDDENEPVTAQVPAAGATAQSGGDVLLYTVMTSADEPDITAEEDEMVTVPGVLDKTRLEASDALKAKGLTIKIDPPDQSGKAIRQSPAAGEAVPKGTEVLVEFSDTGIG